MKKTLQLLFFVSFVISCSQKADSVAPYGCASSQPTLVGKWILTEFRYYGGCCPVIADSSWKKAETSVELQTVIEFTADGNARSIPPKNQVSGGFAAALPNNTLLTTAYTFDGKEITLADQIFGGATWYKKIPVKQLTTRDLTIAILVGKEGETNDRKFVRSCD